MATTLGIDGLALEARVRGILNRHPAVGLAVGVVAMEAWSSSLAEVYQGGLHLVAEPGTRHTYSNHGFATLGQIVEDVSGEPLDRYVREHIFEPLGMADTDLLRSAPAGSSSAEHLAWARPRSTSASCHCRSRGSPARGIRDAMAAGR